MSEDPLREEIAKRMEQVRKDIPVEKKSNWRQGLTHRLHELLVMIDVQIKICLLPKLRQFFTLCAT